MAIGFSLKSCGKAHPHCHICRPDVTKNISRSAGWSKGMTYEQMYGLEKATEIKALRAEAGKLRPPPQHNIPHSKEAKEKMRTKALGRKVSDEVKLKMSAAHKKRDHSRLIEVGERHRKLNLPNCRCYVHGAARPYMVSSYTWKLASSLVALGFGKVIPEAQFGKKRVDSLLADEWLAFEADGNYHFTKERREYDAQRDAGLLERFDLPVVRLSGDEVQRLYDELVREGVMPYGLRLE